MDKWTLQGFWTILRSETLVIESGTAAGISGHDVGYERIFGGKYRIVQTWHGTPLKKICLDVLRERKGLFAAVIYRLQKWEFQRYSLITAQSEYEIPIFRSAFGNHRIQVIGNVRNDVFHDPSLALRNLREEWNIGKSSRVISYVPTFRDLDSGQAPFTQQGWEQLHEWLEKENGYFVVKKHPFDKYLVVPPDYPRIRDATRDVDDIQELLLITDMLITDYSSVCIDFSITMKPIVYYIYDAARYLHARDMYVDLEKLLPGPFAKTEPMLLDLLMSVDRWSVNNGLAQQIGMFSRRFQTVCDGESGQRLLDWIHNSNSKGGIS